MNKVYVEILVQILFSRLNDNDSLTIFILFAFQIVPQASAASVLRVKVIVFLFYNFLLWQTIEHGLLIPSHGIPLL